ncbi:MAG: helix-turn-helix transcriptional regulator [Chromatiales bacterium]|nr:helix-turn-helix transcriptional regulator [Chromatiales bacterium]
MKANTIAARIKLARKMAGLETQAQLLARIPEWKPSRLGNYEAGISAPAADDLRLIAQATGTSPCWLMFGDGPIRPSERDRQAIRHQNLSHLIEERLSKRGALARLAKSLGLSKADLEAFLDNPFLPIDDALARALERVLDRAEGWMDEQQVENDPLCQSFPEDIRELMMLYSALGPRERQVALETLRALSRTLSRMGEMG